MLLLVSFASSIIVNLSLSDLRTPEHYLVSMLSLKNHPFAVETLFECSLVLTYALPKEELYGVLPECLELDTFGDRWAFIAVALVSTRKLRPKGFPVFLGSDFFLIGFRVFVRYKDNRGRRLRGLYILKSETNSHRMSFFGNIFTHYRYSTTDIAYTNSGRTISVISQKSNLHVIARIPDGEMTLPHGSPFASWKEARRFAGPLPFTFSYMPQTKQVIIIEGVRQHWEPKPVEIIKDGIPYINERKSSNIVLANAFIVENVPYYWKKGRVEIWSG